MSDTIRVARPPYNVRAPLSPFEPELIADPRVARERYGVTTRTLRRWDEAAIGFPPPIVIRKRNYRSRQALDDWDRANSTRLAAERSAS
jgi:hypothetical protein